MNRPGDPIVQPVAPMEALLVDALPGGEGWQYEPKWDGFRLIAARNGERLVLWSKSGKPLDRYFPELVAALAACGSRRFIVDGEIILPLDGVLSFADLQARLHPAVSRIERLSRETPARIMLFDMLEDGGDWLGAEPLDTRRARLEAFVAREASPIIALSPATRQREIAAGWLAAAGGALDGVVAKRRVEPYRGGERAMIKVKQYRSADCVVAGFRIVKRPDGGSAAIASLLLGLHDGAGLLHHVGFCSGLAADDRAALYDRLAPLAGSASGPVGFSGKAPGAPSRWSSEATPWTPIRPSEVVEVGYDQVTGDRFRHAVRLLRWRPDKAAGQCMIDQLTLELAPAQLGALSSDAP